MRRLTERDKYGPAVYALTDDYSIRQRLAEYEDLGLSPEELKNLLSRGQDRKAGGSPARD